MQSISDIKFRLKDYLTIQGVQYDAKKKTYRCPNPAHNDNDPSAVFYKHGKHADYPVLWCPICNEPWSIIDVAMMLHGFKDIPETMEHIKSVVGIVDTNTDKKVDKKDTEFVKKPEPEIIPVSHADRRKYYNGDYIKKIAAEKGWGDVVAVWEYTDKNDMVTALDVRFENEGKKTVITWTYNGKLKHYGVEPQIYNLYECLNTDKPILITEGCKCAEISRQLEGFTPCSWSGGAGKAGLIDWTILKDKQIYILPDNDAPGFKAAEEIKKQLNHAVIVKPLTDGKGDDIEQYIDIITPEYILNSSDITPPANKSAVETPQLASSGNASEGGGFSEPFKILGLCEGEGHFIDEWGYYQHYKLDSIGKGRLNNLAQLSYWKSEFPAGRDGVAWDEAVNYIVCSSKLKEFDTKKLKGRGAWRSGDKICYNDGKKIYGEPDNNFIYLKDSQINLGIDSEPASGELLGKIRDIIFDLSFETKTDAVRTMGWTVLAPFCGALEYRPTLLMTGESGHGKTKVQTLFIQKISDFIHADMRTSSEAGIRRKIGKDSRCVFFDEGGKENDKMKLNFDTIMSFIRSNYSDDSPDGFKANMNGDGYVTYKMSSMFGLATTDPTIENVQDENRILRVHFVKPKHTADEWQTIENQLIEILCKENCDKIRALTWSRLKNITCLTKKIVQLARNKTNRDYRSSYADMLLAAAYMVVWCDTPEPTTEQIENMLDKYYQYQPIEENRSEAEEYISRILDEIIEVLYDGGREKLTIFEALVRINDGQIINEDRQYEEFTGKRKSAHIRTLQQYGVKLHSKGVHFANDNHMIKKITGLSKGYEKLFVRHKGYVKHDDPISYAGGGSKRGVIISGLLDKSDVERLENII